MTRVHVDVHARIWRFSLHPRRLTHRPVLPRGLLCAGAVVARQPLLVPAPRACYTVWKAADSQRARFP
jgi:hypothetical protein